jgi:hypothetical protein
MELKFNPANKFYCLGDEDGELKINKIIGVIGFRQNYKSTFNAFNYIEEPEEIALWTNEKALLFLFNELEKPYQVIDTFLNVSDKDIVFANLAFHNNRFCLVNSSAKANRINELALVTNSYLQTIHLATSDQLKEATESYDKAKPDLLSELLKICEIT